MRISLDSKKIRVIIFFQDANHYQTIDNLATHLEKKSVDVVSFNIATWRLRRNSRIKPQLWVRLISLFASIPKVRGLMTNIFRHRAMISLADRFDIVDIHFFSPVYDRFIEEVSRRGKKVKITVWGSDFYRADSIRREQQRKIYQVVDIIQIETAEIAEEFLQVFPECKNKIRFAHFGIIQFDIIDDLLAARDAICYRSELGIPDDKIVLVCGTNASEGHQHLKILESIGTLDTRQKNDLFLLIPMTYGGSSSYIRFIEQKAETLGIPFIVLKSFLELRELCKYRIASDILITIQKTDALASAIQEHLYTGGIMIAGEWLPYGTLNQQRIFYITTSIENLADTISDTMFRSDSIKKLCSNNRQNLIEFSSWSSVVDDWMSLYHELYRNQRAYKTTTNSIPE